MNKRLADREFLAGKYSIADIACIGWTLSWKRQGQEIDDFPNLKRWQETIKARPAAERGLAVRVPDAQQVDMHDPAVRAVLVQSARPRLRGLRGRPAGFGGSGTVCRTHFSPRQNNMKQPWI